MERQSGRDRLYPVVLIGFLCALVAVGLLGVPALLVAAGGAVFAALAIFSARGLFEPDRAPARHPPAAPAQRSRQYVPTVLEGSSARRRRGGHARRRRRPAGAFKFR